MSYNFYSSLSFSKQIYCSNGDKSNYATISANFNLGPILFIFLLHTGMIIDDTYKNTSNEVLKILKLSRRLKKRNKQVLCFTVNIHVDWLCIILLLFVNKLTKPDDGHQLMSYVNFSFWRIGLAWFMMFDATFKDISVVLWQSVLLAKETRLTSENHRSLPSHWQTLSHNVVSSTPRHGRG